MFVESKKRTISKTISWRIVAILNSFLVLSIEVTEDNFLNALYMNITGFCVYYLFERIWNRIQWGKK
tara:strand:+ start:1943 stop:2143 length:201 start_codon:yes stop_codon:yes gene_type:complete